MTCQNCGRQLEKIAGLTEEETQNFAYYFECDAAANQMIRPEVVRGMPFEKEGDIYEYFKAAIDSLGKTYFLRYLELEKLRKRLGTDREIFVFADPETNVLSVFAHAEESAG